MQIFNSKNNQFLIYLLFILILAGIGFSQSEEQLIRENNRLSILSEYKDDIEILRLKLAHLDEINQYRAKEGVPPLELDLLASRLATMHSRDMIQYDYSGHWDSQYRKPYHRYALFGGTEHIAENIYSIKIYRKSALQKKAFSPAEYDPKKFLSRGLNSFLSQIAPHDGHRREILNPHHTHIGIGYAISSSGFRYCQLFLDRYIQLDEFPKIINRNNTLQLTGRTLNPNHGPYGAVVYYDPIRKLKFGLKNQPEKYPDYGDELFIKIPSWEIEYDSQTRRFIIPINFRNAKLGHYYIILYIQSEPEQIPYNPTGKAEWNTEWGIPVSGLVIEIR